MDSLKNALNEFENMKFNKKEIREHSLKFDEAEYRKKIVEFVAKVGKKD